MLVVICIYGIQNWYKGISLSETGRGIFSYIIGYFYGSGYIDNIMGHKIQTVGPIWFCLALFWGFLFLNFILKRKHCLFWAVSLFAAGYYSAFYIWLPFSIQSGMTAVLFIYLGYEAKFFHIMDKIPSIGKYFLCCVFGEYASDTEDNFYLYKTIRAFLLPTALLQLRPVIWFYYTAGGYKKYFRSPGNGFLRKIYDCHALSAQY